MELTKLHSIAGNRCFKTMPQVHSSKLWDIITLMHVKHGKVNPDIRAYKKIIYRHSVHNYICPCDGLATYPGCTPPLD